MWLSCKDESPAVRLMLWVAGVMLFGMLTVMSRLVVELALIAIGLGGVLTHCPEMTLGSQLEVIEPE